MLCRPRSPQCRSPADRLPVELLSYIFILGTHATEDRLEGDAERSPPFTSETIRTPLIISSVSRHWRDIARNTPSLWTSLCITVEMIDVLDDGDGDFIQPPTALNVRHLITYLALSRNYPLDILIDARDQDWDFSEPEVPSEYEGDTYTPPFSSDHMSATISLLLPHLHRWRSIDILTDSWAPMYIALQQIQTPITTLGAPLLESLTLMRCNDFVSYSPTFHPQEMKGPALFNLFNKNSCEDWDVLPRLKNLTLRGVHVDWSSLSSILSRSRTGLRALELSSHCADVRPTLYEFHQLLSVNPSLHKLVINGSGPYIPEELNESETAIYEGLHAISLPYLQEITLGYRSACDGQTILELLDAPNAKTLTLEDSNHPGEPDDVDAGNLLTYVGTGEFHQTDWQSYIPYILADGLRDHVALDKEPLTSSSRRRDFPIIDGNSNSRAVFPHLQNVTLKGVKACPQPLHTFFGALPNLRRLELNRMSMHSIRALLPRYELHCAARNAANCPCPQLQSLCIRGFNNLQLQDFEFIVGGLSIERLNRGACGLREVDIYIDGMSECITEDVFAVSPMGTIIKIFREAYQGDEEDDGIFYDEDAEIDPFKAGGVFNDPLFDAYYAGRVLAH